MVLNTRHQYSKTSLLRPLMGLPKNGLNIEVVSTVNIADTTIVSIVLFS